MPPPELPTTCRSEPTGLESEAPALHPFRCLVNASKSRQAARLRQSGAFCLRWCPFVWSFTNQVTGLGLAARDSRIGKLLSLKARAVSKLSPDRATRLTFLTRPGGKDQNVRAVALLLRSVGRVAGRGDWRMTCQSSRSMWRGAASRAPGSCVATAAAANLRGDLALLSIDSLCKSAAES